MQVLEVWKPVPGYAKFYEVSNLGTVRTKPRRVKHNPSGWRIMPSKPIGCRMFNGYVKCILTNEKGERKNVCVHNLVLLAFVGKPKKGQYALHGPNGQEDHSLANLYYGTQKQNLADQVRDGVLRHGVNHGTSKLTVEQVREAFLSTTKASVLAAEFGVAPTQIYYIRQRKTWVRTTEEFLNETFDGRS